MRTAKALAVQFDADAELLADQLLDRNVGGYVFGERRAVRGLQADGVFEEFTQRLATVE
jgi:hypothetical protein